MESSIEARSSASISKGTRDLAPRAAGLARGLVLMMDVWAIAGKLILAVALSLGSAPYQTMRWTGLWCQSGGGPQDQPGPDQGSLTNQKSW